jgi:Zn-dependent peptidase ImmA (M78 family)
VKRKSTPAAERYWQEIHANWFAAALLMPPAALRRAVADLDITRWRGRYALRDRCGVSISALNSRLRQLGYPEIRNEMR